MKIKFDKEDYSGYEEGIFISLTPTMYGRFIVYIQDGLIKAKEFDRYLPKIQVIKDNE